MAHISKIEKPDYHAILWKQNQRDGHELEHTMEAGKPTNRLRPTESQRTLHSPVTRNVLVGAAAASRTSEVTVLCRRG